MTVKCWCPTFFLVAPMARDAVHLLVRGIPFLLDDYIIELILVFVGTDVGHSVTLVIYHGRQIYGNMGHTGGYVYRALIMR